MKELWWLLEPTFLQPASFTSVTDFIQACRAFQKPPEVSELVALGVCRRRVQQHRHNDFTLYYMSSTLNLSLSSSCVSFWSTSCSWVFRNLMDSKLSLFDSSRLTPKLDVHIDASDCCNFLCCQILLKLLGSIWDTTSQCLNLASYSMEVIHSFKVLSHL